MPIPEQLKEDIRSGRTIDFLEFIRASMSPVEKQGPLPPDIKWEMQRWLDQRDWNFSRGFWETGLACCQNAQKIFDGWYRGLNAD